jgi:hypothetical protein
MVFDLEGELYKSMRTKKGQTVYSVLVQRNDGQRDSVNVLSNNPNRKIGEKVKLKVNAFVNFCSEV